MEKLLDLIKGRKSVRSFDGQGITEEDRKKLEECAAGLTNPFGIPVQVVFLDAEEHGLSSPVLTGEKLYVAGKVAKASETPLADVAFGYSFEKFVLYAWSLGIGTTWIAGTMKRDVFEKAAGLGPDEMMPCISPLGYPADKRPMKEVLMRRGVGADTRKPADKLFFDGNFVMPLDLRADDPASEALEMVRWAPSAVNKQPWRIVLRDGRYHFYEKKDKGYINDATGDLQKIDLGIALCHFVMGLEEKGCTPRVTIADPGLTTPKDTDYIATVEF